jgi:hypothetical protein
MRDILLDDNGDVVITDDIGYVADSTLQHQRDILVTAKGHYKSAPAVGVDIASQVNESNPEQLLRTARLEFTRDGMRVNAVAVVNGNLAVEAYYE